MIVFSFYLKKGSNDGVSSCLFFVFCLRNRYFNFLPLGRNEGHERRGIVCWTAYYSRSQFPCRSYSNSFCWQHPLFCHHVYSALQVYQCRPDLAGCYPDCCSCQAGGYFCRGVYRSAVGISF